MKLTLKNISKLKNEAKGNSISFLILVYLEATAITNEDLINIFNDIVENGWCRGIEEKSSEYKESTNKLFLKYEKEINKTFYEMLKCYGTFDPTKYFTGGEWDETDPLAMEFNNRELLINQVFTNILTEIYGKFEH